MSTNTNDEWKERTLGALWERTGAKGIYYTGKIKVGDKEEQLVVFRNNKKVEGSNQPDFTIYRSEPRDGATSTAKPAAKATSKPANTAKATKAATTAPAVETIPDGESLL